MRLLALGLALAACSPAPPGSMVPEAGPEPPPSGGGSGGDVPWRLPRDLGPGAALAANGDGTFLVHGTRDGAWLLEVETGSRRRISNRELDPGTARFSGDGRTLAIVDGSISIWSAERPVGELIFDLAADGSFHFLGEGGDAVWVGAWQPIAGDGEVRTWIGGRQGVLGRADRPALAASGTEIVYFAGGELKVLDAVAGGPAVGTGIDHLGGPEIVGGGRILASWSQGKPGRLSLLRLSDRQRFDLAWFHDFAVDAQGHRAAVLLAAGSARELRVLDLDTGLGFTVPATLQESRVRMGPLGRHAVLQAEIRDERRFTSVDLETGATRRMEVPPGCDDERPAPVFDAAERLLAVQGGCTRAHTQLAALDLHTGDVRELGAARPWPVLATKGGDLLWVDAAGALRRLSGDRVTLLVDEVLAPPVLSADATRLLVATGAGGAPHLVATDADGGGADPELIELSGVPTEVLLMGRLAAWTVGGRLWIARLAR